MSEAALTTIVDAPLCGRTRRFQLRIGELGELERLARAGIGEISLRLATHRFTSVDVFETLRLGLIGGGFSDVEATALMQTIEGQPIAPYLGIAALIVDACINGVGKDEALKKDEAEGTTPSADPATSPPSTHQAVQ
ncbi:Phage tail tube protein, GTA-gp10 [Rhizobiales bacterium GAS188]|nr:Phage tail tube protein, GTA-gp10 [Rhizobiales bacterium GAS188]